MEVGESLPHAKRIRFWTRFMRRDHPGETAILLRMAKLQHKPTEFKPDNWNNVFKHCAAVALAVRVLCRVLKMPQEQSGNLETVALLHDARKRLEVRPSDFTDTEREELDEDLASTFDRCDPMGALVAATGPAFLERVFVAGPEHIAKHLAEISRDEMLLYVADSIFQGARLVGAMERIAETEKRNGGLNDDPERTRKLGGVRYWDAERIFAPLAEHRIAALLTQQGADLSATAGLHGFVGQAMMLEIATTADHRDSDFSL